MSLHVVVIAVIAIVVLVVLIIMLTGKTKILGKTSSSCASRGAGAECIPAGDPCDGARYTFGTDCPEETPHCCVPMGGSSGGGSDDSGSQEDEDS